MSVELESRTLPQAANLPDIVGDGPVLLVDDDQSVREILEKFLLRGGFAVDTASCGGEAIELLRKKEHPLLLTDLAMPGTNGLELIRRAREICPDTVNVLITGFGSMESAIDAIHEGVYDYITKPVQSDHLLGVVRRGLEKKRLELENRRLMEELQTEKGLLAGKVAEATSELRAKLREVEKLNNEITMLYDLMKHARGQMSITESFEILLSHLPGGLGFDSFLWIALDGSGSVVSFRVDSDFPMTSHDLSEVPDEQVLPLSDLLQSDVPPEEKKSLSLDWLADNLGFDVTEKPVLAHTFASSTGLHGFVALCGLSDFDEEDSRILSLALSQLITLWEENTLIQRGSQMAMIGELTADFAHDLRNPLSAIRHAVDFLSSRIEEDDPKISEYNAVLTENLKRLEWLINELISFSRPSHVNVKTTPVNRLIERVLQVSHHVLESKGIQVRWRPSDENPIVLGDPNELSEVFFNLVMNSVQAMEKGGVLIIKAEPLRARHPEKLRTVEEERFVEIQFQDTGRGIAPESVRKVFNRFFTTKENGTGLGLSVVQRVVRKCLGWVEFESQLGKGTTVSLFLPQL